MSIYQLQSRGDNTFGGIHQFISDRVYDGFRHCSGGDGEAMSCPELWMTLCDVAIQDECMRAYFLFFKRQKLKGHLSFYVRYHFSTSSDLLIMEYADYYGRLYGTCRDDDVPIGKSHRGKKSDKSGANDRRILNLEFLLSVCIP